MSGSLAARFLVGIGAGWLVAASRSPRADLGVFDLSRPVIVRGRLSPDRGRDRWGNYRHDLHLRTVRQGRRVLATREAANLRSPVELRPGSVRIKGFLRQDPTSGWSLTLKDSKLMSSEPTVGGWLSAANWQPVRGWLRQRTEARLRQLVDDPRQRQLLRSLFFGRAQEADAGLQSGFRRLGLGHLFAVSGLHVGILAGLAWILTCGRSSAGRRMAVIAMVSGYALMLDPRGSVIRAATVLVLWQLVELAGRRLDPISTLLACVAALALLDELWIGDLGLQLSVLAVLGILLLGIPAAGRLSPRAGPVGALLSIGLGAQAATLPLTGTTFHWLPPLAPLYGVVAIPWAAMVLSLAVVAVLPPALPMLTSGLSWLLSRLLAAGVWLTDLPPYSINGWPVTTRQATIYATGLILLLIPVTRSAALRQWVRWTGCAVVSLVLIPGRDSPPRLVMLDVGQGDAVLVQVAGRSMLIDGGVDGRRLLRPLADYGVRSLDALLVTHPDHDHCAGGRDLARWIPVREIWTPLGWNARCYWELLRLPGTRLKPLWAGRRLAWRGIRFEVLAPSSAGTRIDNDDSLVLRMADAGRRVLLTGDIEFRGERKLLRRVSCLGLSAKVLKVAHHGGRSSTREELLECIKPSTALISAGRNNSFGHPSQEVLARLEAAGVRVLRTDQDGDILVDLQPLALGR